MLDAAVVCRFFVIVGGDVCFGVVVAVLVFVIICCNFFGILFCELFFGKHILFPELELTARRLVKDGGRMLLFIIKWIGSMKKITPHDRRRDDTHMLDVSILA